MSARQVLLDAADLIERDGWTRGAFDRRGRHCVAGALRDCYGESMDDWFAATNALKRHVGASLPVWNDEQKSRKPVLAALRAAAETVS